jgi:hypothetical protein
MERVRVTPTIIKIFIAPFRSTRKGPKYMVEIPGYDIQVEPTLTPFFSAARALSNSGVVPKNAKIWMMRDGNSEPALTGKISLAAKLTVAEGQRGKMRVAKWSPHFQVRDDDDDTDED